MLESLKNNINSQSKSEDITILKILFEPESNYLQGYETLLNSLYGLQYTNEKDTPFFTFGIICENKKTDFYVCIPNDYVTIFKNKYAVVDSYIQFENYNDPLNQFIQSDNVNYIEGYNMKLMYENNNELPIKKLKTQGAEKNFLNNLLHSMNNADENDKSIIEISLRPLINSNKFSSSKLITKGLLGTGNLIIKGISYCLDEIIMNGQMSEIYNKDTTKKQKSEIDINLYPKFEVSIKLASKSTKYKNVIDNIKGMSSAFTDLSETNALIPVKIKYENIVKRNMKNSNILSTPEIIQFLHLPDRNVSSENVVTSNCKKIYDRDIPQNGIIFGTSNGVPVAFPGIKLSVKTYEKNYKKYHNLIDNLSKPKLVLGQQGTGKSEWIINYVISMAKLGLGIIVVDPKNDTQQRLIESLPEELMHKLKYINLGDTEYPPGFNLFKKRYDNDPTENSLIVTSFISLMKKEAKQWGFKMQRMCQMAVDAVLLNDICTMNELELMLTERVFRETMINKMRNILLDENLKGKSHIKKVLNYWENFNEMEDKNIWKEIDPLMNVIGPFLSNRIVRSIVSQNNSFDFRKSADNGEIVIINIPEGILQENTKLLSSMINKSIWLDIQSRADVDISNRYPVMWVIDEAHEIVDDEFIIVLTRARAYRLGLTLVTQGLSNFKLRGLNDIKELITTNCKNKISFRLGYNDSREMAEEYSPLSFNDLSNCPDYYFYGKILLEDGKVSNPFYTHALDIALKIRNYDEFLKRHRSGKMTVDQIEDELDERLESIKLMNDLINI